MEILRDKNQPSPHQNLFWHLGSGNKPQWAVREGKWKLLGNAQDKTDRRVNVKVDPVFLVDLENDESETTNVAGNHPEIVEKLQAQREKIMVSLKNEK